MATLEKPNILLYQSRQRPSTVNTVIGSGLRNIKVPLKPRCNSQSRQVSYVTNFETNLLKKSTRHEQPFCASRNTSKIEIPPGTRNMMTKESLDQIIGVTDMNHNKRIHTPRKKISMPNNVIKSVESKCAIRAEKYMCRLNSVVAGSNMTNKLNKNTNNGSPTLRRKNGDDKCGLLKTASNNLLNTSKSSCKALKMDNNLIMESKVKLSSADTTKSRNHMSEVENHLHPLRNELITDTSQSKTNPTKVNFTTSLPCDNSSITETIHKSSAEASPPQMIRSSSLIEIKQSLKQIKTNIEQISNNFINKQEELLSILGSCEDPFIDTSLLRKEFYDLDMDNTAMKHIFAQNDRTLDEIVEKITILTKSIENCTLNKNLEEKLKDKDKRIKELNLKLKKTVTLLRERETISSVDDIAKLKMKIKQTEDYLNAEKIKYEREVERNKNAQYNLKSFKTKVNDFDLSKQYYENRITQLTLELKNAQCKLKNIEATYREKLEDMTISRSLDRSVIQKLIKQKSQFHLQWLLGYCIRCLHSILGPEIEAQLTL